MKRKLSVCLLIALLMLCVSGLASADTATATGTGTPYDGVRSMVESNMDAVLILDTSGSMGSYNGRADKEILLYAKEAAQAFLDQALMTSTNYRVGLGHFSDDAQESYPISGQDKMTALSKAIQALRPDGMTNISSGFNLAANMLNATGRKDARQIIVLLSDGMHNTGTEDPIEAGFAAMKGPDGVVRDIYTIGMMGALTEADKAGMRSVLDKPYATRFIEIDGERDLEGIFYVLGTVGSEDVTQEHYVLRIRGNTEVEITHPVTGEMLSSKFPNEKASFGRLFITTDRFEKIFFLNPDAYTFRLSGTKTGADIDIHMETLNGRGKIVKTIGTYECYGTPGTRLSAELSFLTDKFDLTDLTVNPYDGNAVDPFTGQPIRVEIEPANGFLTAKTSAVRSAPSDKASKVGSVGQGVRFKDEFRVLWTDGDWYFIEYDLGTGADRNGVKRGYVPKKLTEVVDGWVPTMFNIDKAITLNENVDLVAMPYNYGPEPKVIKSLKQGAEVKLLNILYGPQGKDYLYIQVGKGDAMARGYIPATVVTGY